MRQSPAQNEGESKQKQNKTSEQLKASIECREALSSLCVWLYAQCLNKGLLSKLWNILQ